MTLLQAFFENGAPGNSILASDPGGPDAFDVTVESGATLTNIYDLTHARGLLSARIQTAASGDQVAFNEWNTTGSYVQNTDSYDRWYIYRSATAAVANSILVARRAVSGDNGARIRTDADWKIRLGDAGGTTRATSAAALPAGQWCRMELHVVHSATVGSMELRVYTTDPEAAVGSYDYALTATNINTDVSSRGFRFGWCLSNVSQPQVWYDAVATGGTGTWIGPAGTEPTRSVLPFTAFPSAAAGTATTSTVASYQYLLSETASRLQHVSTPTCPYGNGLSLRCEVRTSDYDHDGLSDRCEFAANSITYAPTQDFWMAMAIRLDSTFPSVTGSQWQVLHQMFGETSGEATGSPPMALEIQDNFFYITVRGGTKASAGATAPRETFTSIAAATKSTWHEFLFHATLSTSSSGRWRVYYRRRGEQFPSVPQVTDSGINVLTVNGFDQWPYPESGLYRQTRAATGIAYYGLVAIRSDRPTVEAMFNAATWPSPGGNGRRRHHIVSDDGTRVAS